MKYEEISISPMTDNLDCDYHTTLNLANIFGLWPNTCRKKVYKPFELTDPFIPRWKVYLGYLYLT